MPVEFFEGFLHQSPRYFVPAVVESYHTAGN